MHVSKPSHRIRRPARLLLAAVALLAFVAGPVDARDLRLRAGFDGDAFAGEAWGTPARPGLEAGGAAAGTEVSLASARFSGAGPSDAGPGMSPLAAGALSALLPGAGQLAQGSKRGWLYLGVEVASIFSVWALRSAGNRAEDDSERFAGDPDDPSSRWAWDRYEEVTECGEGLGRTGNYEQEREDLRNLYASSTGDFYDEIGDRDVYACGWVTQSDRAEFQSLRDSSNDLFRSARAMVTVVFLNHIVSAVDAAKSASNRRREREQALDLDLDAHLDGTMAVHVTMNRRF